MLHRILYTHIRGARIKPNVRLHTQAQRCAEQAQAKLQCLPVNRPSAFAMHTDCLSADRDPLPDVDDASDDSNAAHNVHAAEVNVDAFWQNPYALSMVSSNTVALRDVKVPVGADSRTPADQLKSDRQRNVASPSPSPELPSATPTRKRKYGSHLCPVCGRSFGYLTFAWLFADSFFAYVSRVLCRN